MSAYLCKACELVGVINLGEFEANGQRCAQCRDAEKPIPGAVCTVERYCAHMDAVLGETARGAHIAELVTTHITTMAETRRGPYFKRNGKHRGLMLNFCPWCGTAFDTLFPVKTERDNET